MKHYSAEWESGKIYTAIKNGETVILRDTDAAFIICSSLDQDAIRKAFCIKGKEQSNPLVLFCASLSMIEKYTDLSFSLISYRFCEEVFPSSTIVLLPTAESIPDIIHCGQKSTGYCSPPERLLRQWSNLLQAPIVLISVPSQVIESKSTEIDVVVDYPLFSPREAIVVDGRIGLHRVEKGSPEAGIFPDIAVR